MKDMKTTAIYGRRSKKKRERADSVKNQIDSCKEYAQEEGYNVVGIYQDDGKTGTNSKRHGLQQLLKDAKEHKFQYVIVWKLDRLARDVNLSLDLEKELKSYGVKIISVTEEINDNSISSKETKYNLNTKAEIEIDRLRENTMRGLRGNAKRSLTTGGTAPLGYDIKYKKYVVNDFEAEAVRLAYGMYANNFSKASICKELNERGYRTKRGGLFKTTSFDRTFTNPKYIGTYTYADLVKNDDSIPPIVDNETFYAVQKRLNCAKQPKGISTGKRAEPLSGLVKCGSCGRNMIVDRSRSGRNKTEYTTFYCPGKKAHSCLTKPVNALYLNDFVIDILTQQFLLSSDAIKAGLSDYRGRLTSDEKHHQNRLRTEIGNVETAIQRLAKNLGSDKPESIIKVYEDEILENQARVLNLQEQLNAYTKKESPYLTEKRLHELLSVLATDLFANGSDFAAKTVLNAIIEVIIVTNDSVVVSVNLP